MNPPKNYSASETDDSLNTQFDAQMDTETLVPEPSTIDQPSPWGAPGSSYQAPAVEWQRDDRLALLEAVLANATDSVFAFDRAGKILDVNHAACTLAEGKRIGDFPGQFIDRWVAEEHRRHFHEALKSLAQGQKAELAFDFITRTGRRRHLAAKLIPLRMNGLSVFVALCQDRTEALLWEGMVRQKQKLEMVGRVAGEIVHDFNNLLTVINGFSELALTGVNPDDPLHSMLQDINHAGDKAAHLTRQFLAFSRRQDFEAKNVELKTIVTDLEKILRRLLGRDIELTVRSEQGPTTIRADIGQIEQILLNLAVNARDAMPQGGRLTIDVRPVPAFEIPVSCHSSPIAGSYLLLSVADSGCGMNDSTKRRIFEPFFTTKGPGKGTGLGLATVAKSVEQNNGLIEVLSDPGRGTTFNIYFPRMES